MPALWSELECVRGKFCSDVQLIHDFVKDTQRSLKHREKRKPKVRRFHEEDKAELDRVVQFFKETTQEMKPRSAVERSIEIKSKAVQSLIMEGLKITVFPKRYARFLAEMALAYLVSFEEAFVKEYLETIFIHRPKMLRSGKLITFDEVCSFPSKRALIQALAEKEVDTISYKNIDEVAKYFQDRLGILLSANFPEWESLREASYRRNLILHNQGMANQLYCSKVGYAKRGEHLETDAIYVERVANVILEFIEFIHAQVMQKLKLGASAGNKE